MATPNYGYEKRQKELAKKRKKEDKLKAKAERKTGPGEGDSSSDETAEPGTGEQTCRRPTMPGRASKPSTTGTDQQMDRRTVCERAAFA